MAKQQAASNTREYVDDDDETLRFPFDEDAYPSSTPAPPIYVHPPQQVETLPQMESGLDSLFDDFDVENILPLPPEPSVEPQKRRRSTRGTMRRRSGY
jgi:hypothetical protein